MTYDPPAKTKSFYTHRRETARDFFTLDKLARRIDPGPELWRVLWKAAVAISAYKPERGRKSPFPNPEDFVCSHLGIDPEAPASEANIGYRNARLVRFVHKLDRHLDKRRRAGSTEMVQVGCPYCGERSIECEVFTYGIQILDFSPETPALAKIVIECQCTGFTPEDFDRLEERARKA